jgi:DNA (cytosine-5)-methyltransferase 1
MLTYGSVCSGIEAASVAWRPFGWRAAFLSEIEDFPRRVLKLRHPGAPLHGDFTTIGAGQYDPIQLLVGGTPCQSFSVAGLRGGLDDDRGNLALEYLRLARRLRPRWLVWENVPGVLSSNGGRDFGAILGGMVELGYGVAYRVLDAQFFGVPQRRRRVFAVGHLGDWRRAAAVLFERDALLGRAPPRRRAGAGAAGALPGDAGGRGARGDVAPALSAAYAERSGQDLRNGAVVAFDTTQVTHPENRSRLEADGLAPTLAKDAHAPAIAFTAKDYGQDMGVELAPTLRSGGHAGSHANGGVMPAVAFAIRGRDGGAQAEPGSDQVGALRAAAGGSSRSFVADRGARRLTPRECERLQGFPDDYTLVPGLDGWRDVGADESVGELQLLGFETRRTKGDGWRVNDPDGPRYRALGNSMAVPVMRWLGYRIALVEALGVGVAA